MKVTYGYKNIEGETHLWFSASNQEFVVPNGVSICESNLKIHNFLAQTGIQKNQDFDLVFVHSGRESPSGKRNLYDFLPF